MSETRAVNYLEIPNVSGVFILGNSLVITGVPPDESVDPECEIHNCDDMGCGMDHVLLRAKITNLATTGVPQKGYVLGGVPPTN